MRRHFLLPSFAPKDNISMVKAPFLLVVEDDADDKFLFKSVFEERASGILLDFVSNGVELFNYLDNIKANKKIQPFPTVILLDLNMPKMDGKEALKKLKEEPAYHTINSIIFSTTSNEAEIKNCYDLGADSYIIKPSSYDCFLETIDFIKNICMKYFSATQTLALR